MTEARQKRKTFASFSHKPLGSRLPSCENMHGRKRRRYI